MLGLAQQNGFDPAFLQSLLTLVKCTAKPNTCQRKFNKYDLTAAPRF
jgi:hypothetical protein